MAARLGVSPALEAVAKPQHSAKSQFSASTKELCAPNQENRSASHREANVGCAPDSLRGWVSPPEADLRASAAGTRPDPGPRRPYERRARRLPRRRASCLPVHGCRHLLHPRGPMAAPATSRALPGPPNHKRPSRGFVRRSAETSHCRGTIDIRSMLEARALQGYGNVSIEPAKRASRVSRT